MTESFRFDAGVGDRNSPIESEPYAQRWRIDLQAAVEHLSIYPSKVHSLYELGTSYRLWTFLKNASGKAFSSFSEFCVTPKPHGLGSNETTIRAALEDYLGKRGAQLETVAEPRPANQYTGSATDHNGPKQNTGTLRRLRAINRAPEAVREAYRDGRISQTVAAQLGPKNPTPGQAAKIAEAASAIRKTKNRRESNRTALNILGRPERTRVERAMSNVRRMTESELYDFEDLFNAHMQSRRRP